jgi:hypothetical protein
MVQRHNLIMKTGSIAFFGLMMGLLVSCEKISDRLENLLPPPFLRMMAASA